MKTLITLLLAVTSLSFFAQKSDFDIKFKKVEEVLKEKKYDQALSMYLELYNSDPENANLAQKVGYCYLQSIGRKEKAVPYLEKAVKNVSPDYKEHESTEKRAPILAYKLLGDAYHIDSQFDKAVVTYNLYRQEMKKHHKHDKANEDDADHKIEMCYTAKELMKVPVKMKVENMGPNVNSKLADYSPVLTADGNTMIFTSRREGGTSNETYDDGKYFEDIYITDFVNGKWTPARNIGPPINTQGNDATVGITIDGQNILIYKDDNGDGNIYRTHLEGDKWSEPEKLNSNINSKYWEPSAFITADGNMMYFVSDRPGGYGGRDIYVSHLTDDGQWGKAMNLGKTINTAYDEEAPVLHPDGITLFFSSTGHKTMGGFDIFYSTMSENGDWQEPVNVGFPVNSPDDDVFYVVSPDKTKAYYSSYKEGGVGEKDNYMITFLDQKQQPLTLLKGEVKDDLGKVPKNIEITVTDNENGKLVGVYRTNSKTGQYVMILTPGRNYNISYEAEGFMFYSENRDIPKTTNYYEIYRPVLLPPIIVGSKVVLNNIFFDFDKSTLRTTSNVELRNLVRFMNKYPAVNVEISGYTDSKGTEEYNLKLSQDRAQAVVTFLITKGINTARMTAKGYGEKNPDAANQKADGSDDPAGRQLNRRVELKITSIKP
jgi:outer membrane protein OmpA-like peptidoglycan-associated protein